MSSPQVGFPQEVPLDRLSGDQLRARVARAQMYLIEMVDAGGSGGIVGSTAWREHLSYLGGLERDGRLFGAGPVSDGMRAAEIAIIAASSPAQAEGIANTDPLHSAGLRVNSVRSYTINEGVACYVARAMSMRAQSLNDPYVASRVSELPGEALATMGAGVQMFLVPLVPTSKPRPPEDTTTMDSHFVWLRENEMAARLMACGPLQSDQPLEPGIWGGGMGIFATSKAAAEFAASVEPSGVAGYRTLAVIPWTLDYGLAAPIAGALVTLNGWSR